MRWPYSVIGDGGCTDPRWVASFTKVSFVNQSATGDPRGKKKAFKLCLCLWGVHSLQKHETELALTSHWSEKTTPEILNYFWYNPANCAILKHTLYDWSVSQRPNKQFRFCLFDGLYVTRTQQNRLSHRTKHRRLYSTFVTSSENKAI